MGSTSEVHHAFESMGLKCSSEVIPTPTPLCKYHYHLTYNALQPRECATCGTRLRGNNHRPCPKPDVIQEHLRERTGFEGEIHSQDRVCITCYKSHLVVLKADPQCVSRDNDLKQLVSTYTKQMPAIQRGATSSDVIKAAMARTVVHVGNILLQNQAILLPTIHSVFTSYITDLLKGTDIGIEDIGHISSRRVLSDLTTSLQHHITYSCKIRKYGTLVYRLGADLTPSLSEALWRLRSTETSTNEPKAPDGPATCSRDLDHINKLVHKQIANFLAQDAHSPFEHDEVNFDDLITQIDPELWNIVCTLTKSKSENRGTSKVTDPLSPAYHVKRIRHLFLICTILFCTDDRCSMPLHTLLTDTVESQGGSALLVQILNRLGVCASSDTLSRFIQYQVSKDKPDVKYLKPDTFTLISADNIDFMHSFARVYCGHQTSSWHGTTVQAAQPLPSLSLPEMDPSSVSLLPAPMDPSQIGRPATCPNMDPSPVGLKPAPMNPSQIGPPATSPTMDPSYVGLKPAPMNPSQIGPPATSPTMDPSYVGLKPAPMNPSPRGPPATCPTMDPSYVGLKPAPMNPSQRGPPATCPNMDPSYVGLKPAPMNPSPRGPPATCPTMDPSYVGLKPAPMNPSQIGPPATYSHTMSVLSRKRTERSSPIHSPMKLTRSPLAKVQRRLRTGTERQKQQAKSQAPELHVAHGHSSHHSSLSLSDFLMSERETDALVDLQKDLDSYILHRVAISTSTSQKPFLNIQDFFSCIRVTHTEKSQIVYLEVMDSIADRKDTVMQLLHDLHQRFIADKDMQWLVLEGDAKLYEIMKSLQFEYGDELSWVIPYPGDWHMLMNYQSALMKAYYDAGLKALARAAGYPLAAIQNSSQFKRTISIESPIICLTDLNQ